MSASNAWLLECGDALLVAVSDHQIVEYIQPQHCYQVPATPLYCSSVVAWQDKLVPVLDLELLSGARKLQQEASFACLLSYQTAPRQPLQYLALRINRTPEKVLVDDGDVCDFPADELSPLLKSVSLCCFKHAERAVPILDLPRLCSSQFREMAQAERGLPGANLPLDEAQQVESGRVQQ